MEMNETVYRNENESRT